MRRLVMVATSFWSWELHEEWKRFQRLLVDLLTPSGDETGWILPVTKLVRRCDAGPVDPEAVVSGLLDVAATPPEWLSGTSAEAGTTIEQIVANLQEIGDEQHDGKISVPRAVSNLEPMTVRIFLPPARARVLFGADGDATDPAYSVTLDFGFTCVEIDSAYFAVCLASASVWSDPPYSGWHAPAEATHAAPKLDVSQAERMARFYLRGVRAGIRRFLRKYLREPNLTTLRDTRFAAPIYWFLAGDEHQCNWLGATLLRTEDLEAAPVSAATEAGSLRMYRRMVDDAGTNVPLYVFLADPPLARADAKERARLLARQEESSAHVVLAARELELQVAVLTFDIDSDLDLWAHYLRLYDEATEQGIDLWDAIAMHLPVAPRRKFDRAHRVVALIHQALLQSVADLAYVTNKVQEARKRLDNKVATLQVQFDRTTSENRQSPGQMSAALGDDGYRGTELRRLDRVMAEIARIKGNFQGLFDAITKAFDERRSRETDRFSRSNLALAGTLAVFGIVAVLDASFEYMATPNAGFRVVLLIATWLLAVLAVTAGLYAWLALRGRRLGSRKFRRAYKKLRDYLRQVSTVELRAKQEKMVKAGLGASALDDEWNALDKELSYQLERTWRSVRAIPEKNRSARVRGDLIALENNVGQWALRTMLLNERPIRLYQYNLPRLIALYCALSAADPAIRVNAVARFDVDVMVNGLGFERRHHDQISKWLRQQKGSVRDVAEAVRDLRLRNGMTDEARQRTVEIINDKTPT